MNPHIKRKNRTKTKYEKYLNDLYRKDTYEVIKDGFAHLNLKSKQILYYYQAGRIGSMRRKYEPMTFDEQYAKWFLAE